MASLAKRRSQLKAATGDMVRAAMTELDALSDVDCEKVIGTLEAVSEGKIYLEEERALLVKRLAGIKEKRGDVGEAAEVLQKVAVETLGTMATEDKIEYILEQVRLFIAKGDWPRAQIYSRKIQTSSFEPKKPKKKEGEGEGSKDKGGKEAAGAGGGKSEDGTANGAASAMEVDAGTSGGASENVMMEEAEGEAPRLEQLKLRYYRQMVQIHQQDDKTLEVCRCYLSMYHTPSVQRDATQFLPILRSVCWYLVLSQSEPMQVSLVEQVFRDTNLDKDDSLKRLLEDFRSQLPVSWADFQGKFASEMAAQDVFSGEGGAAKRETLRLRVIQHNILALSRYYERLTLTFFAELLDLGAEEAESKVAEMVTQGLVWAKIDQMEGTVAFTKRKEVNETLNDWSGNIGKLVDKLEKVTFLVNKEFQNHKIPTEA